ncbi:MAG: 16S rRNA (uracil(1498)-N(3))-methyltransferase [Verrucomicrobiae bacterium]|nr:16S rRNA (uracil(1498)-N(3))-methyltransferase [Verrucomicrobiae bacterium]
MDRFFVSAIDGGVLAADEAHHCREVLRHRSGETITVFDGRGNEARCEIIECRPDRVAYRVLTRQATPRLRCRVVLGQAIPKRSMDLIVQKATELGVAELYPLISDRTVVEATGKMERWRAIALEACKQSGNNWLPVIHPPQPASSFLQNLPTVELRLIASLQPDARALKTILAEETSGSRSLPASVLVLVGPEGDFTPAELALAKAAGCRPLSLGPLVLRSETAALYTLSILHHELQV